MDINALFGPIMFLLGLGMGMLLDEEEIGVWAWALSGVFASFLAFMALVWFLATHGL